MGKKYYGIKKGFNVGVFTNWEEVKNNINGYSGAIYKGFATKEEAEIYVGKKNKNIVEQEFNSNQEGSFKEDILIYSDGSFLEEKVGYGLVILNNSNEIIIKDCGKFNGDISTRNVAGEIFAIIRAVQLIKANELNNITFYHDYIGVANWISGDWKAKDPLAKRYVEYFNQHMKGINFRFVHCFAHNGNKWNEEADRLAKLGTTL